MYWQQIQHNLKLKEPGHFLIYTFYRRASKILVGPVESILHWSSRLEMLISTPVTLKLD